MNKSNQNNRKDEVYHAIMESKGLMNFSKWFKNCMQGQGDTGATEECAPYDAWMRTAKGKYVVEIKCRDVPYGTYDTMYIECDKYADGLCYYIKYGLTPLYVNFFSDGWCWIVNLLDVMFPKKEVKRNAKNKGYNTEECNTVYKLPIKQGEKFRYEVD